MKFLRVRNPLTVLWCGALILALTLGVRHTFGLFLQPMSLEHGWGREVFAFAIALQNLVWGLTQPFVGRLSDRLGAFWAILGGGILYIVGLALMAHAESGLGVALTAGVIIGLALSGTTFPVVFGAISRALPPEKRTMAMGIAMSVGSLGQFAMLPGALSFMSLMGWAGALVMLSFIVALTLPLGTALHEEPAKPAAGEETRLGPVLWQAFRHTGFWLLSLGFVVCGFQVVFVATHLPAYLLDNGLPAHVGTYSLALIGLFNIAGSYLAGLLGSSHRKPMLLAFIYAARGSAIAAFMMLPLTEVSVYAFSIVMGLLWLSTVPLTNGTVAGVFGVRNMSMLGGIVFLFHQLGAFLGGWLGGYVFDLSGSYQSVWVIAIGLSVIAAILNWPISDRPAGLRQPTTRLQATSL